MAEPSVLESVTTGFSPFLTACSTASIVASTLDAIVETETRLCMTEPKLVDVAPTLPTPFFMPEARPAIFRSLLISSTVFWKTELKNMIFSIAAEIRSDVLISTLTGTVSILAPSKLFSRRMYWPLSVSMAEMACWIGSPPFPVTSCMVFWSPILEISVLLYRLMMSGRLANVADEYSTPFFILAV